MSAGNVLAYAPWHARDAVVRALVPGALWVGIGGIPIALLIQAAGLDAVRTGGPAHENARMIYLQTLPLAMTLGALIVGSGFVSEDRDRGHVRFLFSTPVVVWQYYLQRFTIGILLFAAALALVPWGFGLLLFPVPVWPVVSGALLYALLLGALAMLAGALTRRDGAVIIVVTLVASVLQQAARMNPEVPGWVARTAAVLPPVDTADQVRTAWFAGRAADTGDLVYVLAYALGMLVTALAIVRRAPLAR